MICPKCECEYREGFTRCTDCGVDLIDPEADRSFDEVPSEDGELISVLETQNARFLDKLITKLESKNIPYMLQSGTAFDLTGSIDEEHPLLWKAVLWVPFGRSEKVKAVIDKLQAFMASQQETE